MTGIHYVINYFKRNFLYLIFLILSIIITTINIGGKYEINFINIQWPFNSKIVFFNLFKGLTLYNYGNINFISFFNFPETLSIYILYIFHFPVYLQELFLLSLLQFIALYYFYKLFNKFIFYFIDEKTIKEFISAIISILIVFSFASQILYWWNFIPGGFFLMAFGSAMIYYTMLFFDSYLKYNTINKRYLIYIYIFSSLSISVNTPFNISFIWLLLIFPPFLFINSINKKTIKKLFFLYIIIIPLIILANLWYIIPTLMETFYVSFSNTSSVNSNLAIFYYYSITKNDILNILLFKFQTSQYSYSSIGTSIFSKYGYTFSYIIFPLIFGGIISHDKKTNKLYFYLLFIYIITFLLLIGNAGPFRVLYLDIIFKNGDLLTALRNPYIALIFSFNALYIMLIGVSSYRILTALKRYFNDYNFNKFKKYKNKIIKFSSIIIIILLIVPVILSSSPAIYSGNAISSSPLKSRVQVPAYELETADYIKNKLDSGNYVYLFPGGFINQTWAHGYDGFDILPNLIGSNYVIDSPENNILSDICNYIKTGETDKYYNFASALSDLGIKYLVVEGNITYTPYWSYTYTPDYNSILNSLNNTINIKFLDKIGSNYIYENQLNSSILYIPEKAINSNSCIAPVENITGEYYNDTLKPYNLSPDNFINATFNNKINIDINETDRNITENLSGRVPFSYTGYGGPSIFNEYPLNINPEKTNYLIIKFKTNNNAAFTLDAITTDNTTGNNEYTYYLAKSGNIYNLFGSYNTLGSGDSKLSPAYGGDWCSNTNVTTMVINLNDVTDKNINKLLFSILPVADNGTGLRNVPVNNWPAYENLTIYSIELGNNLLFNPYKTIAPVENITGEYYNNYNTLIFTKNNVDLNANLSYKTVSNENFKMNINFNKSNNNPIPVILSENFVKGWKVTYNDNVSNVEIINNHNYSTEILIFPNGKGNNITIDLSFSGNREFIDILLYSLLIYIIPILLLISLSLWHLKRRIRIL